MLKKGVFVYAGRNTFNWCRTNWPGDRQKNGSWQKNWSFSMFVPVIRNCQD